MPLSNVGKICSEREAVSGSGVFGSAILIHSISRLIRIVNECAKRRRLWKLRSNSAQREGYAPVIGGVLFGAMAGYNYWFPKAFGLRLDERWGKASFLIDGAGSTSGAVPCTSSSANRYCAFWPPAPQSDMVRYPVTRAPGSCVVRLEVRL